MKKLFLIFLLLSSICYADRPENGPPGHDDDSSWCDEHPGHPLCPDTEDDGNESPIDTYVYILFLGAILYMYKQYKHGKI